MYLKNSHNLDLLLKSSKTMDSEKRRRLEAAGWQCGTVDDFLGLTSQESAFIEMRLSLSHYLKELRTRKKLTQQALAKKIKSSQSRVAKMESGDPSSSLDLIINTLLEIGATPQEIGEVISSPFHQVVSSS
jgi:DNA-binding XRE family transcriptional regulator